jgi:hypothetical protein
MSESQTKVALVNELIDVEQHMAELWKYHPSNPNRIDLVTCYEQLKEVHSKIESELDNIN